MAVDLDAINARVKQESRFVDQVRAEVASVIVGQRHLIDRLLIALRRLLIGEWKLGTPSINAVSLQRQGAGGPTPRSNFVCLHVRLPPRLHARGHLFHSTYPVRMPARYLARFSPPDSREVAMRRRPLRQRFPQTC